MTLIEGQILFARLLGRLLTYASEEGIALTGGEWWRSPEQAEWNLERGVGIRNSLHCKRLAVDLLCWRLEDGKWRWLQRGDEPEYRQLGNKWKGLHKLCRWGGDFLHPRPDPGHFSIEWDGTC